jgi:opacity protein-like surface antigen
VSSARTHPRSSLAIGWLALALLLACSSPLRAQANPTASRAGDLQIGIGYTIAKPDYGQQNFHGFTVYADFDLRSHLGIEAEFHQVSTPSSNQSYQRTYEVGGRYFRAYGPLIPYVKVMIGRGDFNYPFGATDLAYNLYAGGIGADYRLRPSLNLRAEYEMQRWSGFSNTGLNPQLVTFGLAYHFASKPPLQVNAQWQVVSTQWPVVCGQGYVVSG